jgi:hypothetical protein
MNGGPRTEQTCQSVEHFIGRSGQNIKLLQLLDLAARQSDRATKL